MKPCIILLLALSLTASTINAQDIDGCGPSSNTTVNVIIKSNGSVDSIPVLFDYVQVPDGQLDITADTVFIGSNSQVEVSIYNVSQYDYLGDFIYLLNGKLIDSSMQVVNAVNCGPYTYVYKLYSIDTSSLHFNVFPPAANIFIPIIARANNTGVNEIINHKPVLVNGRTAFSMSIPENENLQSVAIYDISGRACKINSTINNSSNLIIDATLPADNICILRVITDKNSFCYKFLNN